MATYEFFKKQFEFKGKHAKMVQEMWVQNDVNKSYFKRLIDLYTFAPIIGFKMGRKAKEDSSPFEPKSIFAEQMIRQKEDLDFILQMILMLEYEDSLSEEECIKIAFRGAESEEEFKKYNDLFKQYVLGGVEVLYEKLVIPKLEVDSEYKEEKVENIMNLLKNL